MIRRGIVRTFLGHELRDLRTNSRVVPLFFIFPILGIVFPVAIALLGPSMVTEAARDPGMMAVLKAATNVIEFQGLDMSEAMTRYMLRAVVAFYLLMPIAVASTAAAFSIVGEKQQRTLEPILATPITDREFLASKLMVCLVPTVAVTWLTAVRLSRLAPVASRKAASTSRVLSPRAYISTARRSSSAVRPASPARTRDTKGSTRSATWGTPYSIAPSAVRSVPWPRWSSKVSTVAWTAPKAAVDGSGTVSGRSSRWAVR